MSGARIHRDPPVLAHAQEIAARGVPLTAFSIQGFTDTGSFLFAA